MDAHDRLAEQAASYAVGALGSAERAEFEAHLATCETCAAEVRAFGLVTVVLAELAPTAEPSPDVRDRVVAAVHRPATRSKAAASPNRLQVAFSVFRGLYAYQVQLTASQAQVTNAVIEAADVVEVVLEGEAAAPQASGLAFISRARGIVLVATKVPAPPAGRTYQVWLLAPETEPVSVGLVEPDASGQIAVTLRTDPNMPSPTAIAVTMEREGGAPVPAGPAYLVGTTN